MRVIVQRCSRAEVRIDNQVYGKIGTGFLLLVGITHEDSERDADYIAKKVANMRIFNDAEGKMNLALKDVNGAILSISQFTLYGDTRKGNRTSRNHQFLHFVCSLFVFTIGGRPYAAHLVNRLVERRGRDLQIVSLLALDPQTLAGIKRNLRNLVRFAYHHVAIPALAGASFFRVGVFIVVEVILHLLAVLIDSGCTRRVKYLDDDFAARAALIVGIRIIARHADVADLDGIDTANIDEHRGNHGRTIAEVLLWLSLLAALWMVLEPSMRRGEGLSDSRRRVAGKMVSDPLFWILLVVIAFSGFRALNTGIALSYNAEIAAWYVSDQVFPLLPGSVKGSGGLSFSATVSILDCAKQTKNCR